jgi:hypothetical protein
MQGPLALKVRHVDTQASKLFDGPVQDRLYQVCQEEQLADLAKFVQPLLGQLFAGDQPFVQGETY